MSKVITFVVPAIYAFHHRGANHFIVEGDILLNPDCISLRDSGLVKVKSLLSPGPTRRCDHLRPPTIGGRQKVVAILQELVRLDVDMNDLSSDVARSFWSPRGF